MPTTYELIDKKETTGNVSSVVFTTIPSTYTDLVVKCYYKYQSGSGLFVAAQYNSDGGGNYAMEYFYATGSANAASSSSTDSYARLGNGSSTHFSQCEFQISRYANTSINKVSIGKCNAPGFYTITYCSTWRNTNAINRIELFPDPAGVGFTSGCTFTLYGIKAA